MLNPQRLWGCRLTCFACTFATAWLTLTILGSNVGCSHQCPEEGRCSNEKGYCDPGLTQVQFYAPPGATVTVDAKYSRSHQIASYGPYNNRLEQNPEEFSVFNLPPGRHEFKYTSVEGVPGVTIYGELDVKHANSRTAQIFRRRAFIPIALPSEYYRRVEVVGNELYPYRGESFRTAIDAHDLERLSLGDVVEKVFVIADLEATEEELEETEVKIAAIEREIEYADARFRYAYLDFRLDVTDSRANFWRTDRKFIEWEKKRQRLEQDLEHKQAKLARLQAIRRADRVLARQGMLVISTEEVIRSHRDVEEASGKIGEVLLVMRIGGRHMHWGDPTQGMVVQER